MLVPQLLDAYVFVGLSLFVLGFLLSRQAPQSTAPRFVAVVTGIWGVVSWAFALLLWSGAGRQWRLEDSPQTRPRPKEMGSRHYPLTPVSHERLLKGTDGGQDWLMYGGNYQSWRYSPLLDVNRQNVSRLRVAWSFATGEHGKKFQTSPLVIDSLLYLTTADNQLVALDAATGELLWSYKHPLPDDLRLCCGPANRGAAAAGDNVIMATLDARLVALNRGTGEVAWNVKINEYSHGYSATLAPLVVKDKVFVGVAGSEYGIRGHVDAYNAQTGELLWRRYTVPAAGEKGVETWAGDSWKRGGGSIWVTGSYDPEQDLLFWATGNPSPTWNGDVRLGDNLYTDSVLALVPETGEVRWYFQFTPHDVWDYDGSNDIFLLDVLRGGQTVRALAQANRNGYLYVLDRTTGRYLHGAQYVDQLNWSKELDELGRPVMDPKFTPTAQPGEYICPGVMGGKNGSYTAAYSPVTQYIYVPVIENCWQVKKKQAFFIPGIPYLGGSLVKNDQTPYGQFSAIAPTSGAVQWRYADVPLMLGGTLTTGGGLVFTGSQSGHIIAFDDTTGEILWKFDTGAPVRGQPVTYKVNGRQYVAIPSGDISRSDSEGPRSANTLQENTLIVFSLPEQQG